MKCPLFVMLLGAVTATQGCTVDSRYGVLEDMAARVIVPTYATFLDRSEALAHDLDVLCSDPTAHRLERARAAWREACAPFKRSEAFSFGPVRDQRIQAAVDFWPLRTARLEQHLQQITQPTVKIIDERGATAQGLPVLEYLLFVPAPVTEALAALTDDNQGGSRCLFAAAVARHMYGKARVLHSAWTATDGYRPSFTQAGKYGTAFGSPREALELVVNRLLSLMEQVISMKLGLPLGKQSGGHPNPENVESPYSDNSVQDLLNNIAGVRELYGAVDDAAFARADTLRAFVRERSVEVDKLLVEQLLLVEQTLRAIDIPLSQAVVDRPDVVEAAYEAAKGLKLRLATDLATQLNATVTFTDNDGD